MNASAKAMLWSIATVLVVTPIVAGQGGGTVSNRLPTVESFTSTAAAVNDGSTDVLTGEVRDRNGEDDIVLIRITTTSGPVVNSTRLITATDRSTALEPPTYDASGWKVWNPLANTDGRLRFAYQFSYPAGASATYVWRMSVQDEGALQTGPAADLTVAVQARISGGGGTVNAAGVVEPGVRWGAWTVDPGAANVEASNFIAITNTGVTPTQAVTLDFTDSSFIGVTDPNWSIAIDANIQFAIFEDTTPSVTSPSEGTYTYGLLAPLGSVTASFTGTDNVMYIKYQIVSLPETLKDQAYEASYTVSAV